MFQLIRCYVLTTVMILSLLGCALLPRMNPLMNEDRTVTPVEKKEQKVIFKDSMVWYDGAPQNRGILFPAGEYVLEAEDKEYLYFKAPKEFDYRIFKDGKTVDSRLIKGGLFLSKETFNMVPAGAYIKASDNRCTLTWKLGSEFLQMKNDKWYKQP